MPKAMFVSEKNNTCFKKITNRFYESHACFCHYGERNHSGNTKLSIYLASNWPSMLL